MPTKLLNVGVVNVITNNAIMALPAKACRMFITALTATSVDISNNADMSNAKNSVVATGPAFSEAGVDTAAGFIRVNGGNANIRLV